MALGVDGIVAAAALAENAPHVAVLGTGIDIVYPAKHQIIYDELTKRGTVISEYAPVFGLILYRVVFGDYCSFIMLHNEATI